MIPKARVTRAELYLALTKLGVRSRRKKGGDVRNRPKPRADDFDVYALFMK